jgi:hypothetical protein
MYAHVYTLLYTSACIHQVCAFVLTPDLQYLGLARPVYGIYVYVYIYTDT